MQSMDRSTDIAAMEAMEAGFFAYLTKPIKINEFTPTLNKALKSSQVTSSPIANEKPA